MWQRFTERARRIVFYAQEEAGKLGENYVSTEHLLLGLLREGDSVASRILDRMGVSLDRIRQEIERQVQRGDGRLSQDMQLTPRAKRVIDLSYDEAHQLSNNYIGTEHLLLGLIREETGLAGRILAHIGVDLERTREEVRKLQDNVSGIPTAPAPDYARQFAQKYARLSSDQQAAIQSEGVPLHQLPETMQALIRLMAGTNSQSGHILPDPNGLIQVNAATIKGGIHYTVTTKAVFQINLVVEDE